VRLLVIFYKDYAVKGVDKMNLIRHSKLNDCSVCAIINALITLGISVNRESVEKAARYNENGGFPDTGLKIISEQLNLKGEYYPKYDDVIWIPHPVKERVTIASEDNKEKFFPRYKERLTEGWVAVTSIRWEDTEDFHAVALIGVEGEKIKVCYSVKGVYLADQEI
jgi:hypothetical protein